MPTNVFFENYNNVGEQTILEDLIIESIQIYGMDMFYIPRKINAYDSIVAEDTQSSYENAYMVELYLKSVDGFGGDGSFLSKFDLEIRDRVTFTIARRVFEEEIITNEPTMVRPNEGDLIFFPLNKKCFQIKYVDKFPMYYPLGALPTYDLQCELFEYSGEKMSTGIPEIDVLQTSFSVNMLDYALRTEDGISLITEDGEYIAVENYLPTTVTNMEENDPIQQGSDSILDFTEIDPFSDGAY